LYHNSSSFKRTGQAENVTGGIGWTGTTGELIERRAKCQRRVRTRMMERRGYRVDVLIVGTAVHS